MTTNLDQSNASSVGPAMQKMLVAFPDLREKSNGWWFHPDNPTFDVREGEHGEIYIHSWTNKSDEQILASGGLKPSDITSGQRGYFTPKVRDTLDLLELAQAKGIHWHALESFGLRDGYKYHGYNCIKIPYYNSDGSQHTKIRVRKAISGKGAYKQCWDEGTPGDLIPYGLHKLDMARQAGYTFLGEGESDGWANWLHNLPYLGVPGATLQKTLQGIDLNNIPCIYILDEPDQFEQMILNGQGFYKNIHKTLRANKYAGEIYCIDFKKATGYKDPSELHYHLWREKRESEFEAIMQQVREKAIPANDTEILPPETTTLDKAIEESHLDAVLKAIPLLAQLDVPTYLSYEIKIKKAFKDLNMRAFSAEVRKKRDALAAERARARQGNEGNAEYESTDDGMFYRAKFDEPVKLSNFSARIMADVITDDGAERTRYYEIDAALFGRQFSFELPARDFVKCDGWVDEHLGSTAIIAAGQSIKSHLVNAIKYCSIPQEMFKFAHTGWREIDGKMVYLHAGGFISQVSQVEEHKIIDLTNLSQSDETASRATLEDDRYVISQNSQVSQVNRVERGLASSVSLRHPLDKYYLPEERNQVQQAIHASLKFLDLTKDITTVPLYCAVWRAVLSHVDFGVHLSGQSGWGKTELVVLIQQHFGVGWHSRLLPGSWESTENSLEMLLFQAKDTVVVVDDFKPKGTKTDQDRLHTKADRVFRSIGNGAGRGRLNSNLEQRAERRPRCMLISTGEDVPRGQSLKARSVMVAMIEKLTTPGSVLSKNLKAAQKDGKQGLYAQAMAAYLEWLAPHIEKIQTQLPDFIETERDRLNIEGHGRAGSNTAHLLIGMRFFLQFACECDAITPQEAQRYLERCETALRQVAKGAAQENDDEKPSEQWRRLLIAAVASKNAYLVTPDGKNPGTEYGWIKSVREIERDGEMIEEETYKGGGTLVGWIDGEDIYLSPSAAYAAVRAMGSATGDEVTTSETILRKFLAQDKVLASTDLHKSKRPTITIRKFLEKVQRDVLHIKRNYLYPPSESVDLLDYPDYSASESAPQAISETSQVNGKSANKSSERVDYSEQQLTKSASSTPERQENYCGTAYSLAYVRSLYDELQTFLKQFSTTQLITWFAPGTEFDRTDMVRPDVYHERVRIELNSKDRKRITAMVAALEKKLGKDGE